MTRQAGSDAKQMSAKDGQNGVTGNGTTIALVLIWLGALLLFVVLTLGQDGTATQVYLTGALTFLIALALTLSVQFRRAVQDLRQRSSDLHSIATELLVSLERGRSAGASVSPIAQSKIDALTAAQEQTDTRLSLFFSRRGRADAPALVPQRDDAEPLLALDDTMRVDTPAPSAAELIRALHFPEDENDADGFDALRKALADSRTSNLIRAAQEVLTHLAQEGIYMDDLRPDRARPEFWRAFAAGTRGTLIAPLGGIRDRSCLALTAARMRANPDFKETAHLFLREFDKVFAAFEKDADDAQIAALSETRSARAFMLLGRVSGVFSR